MIFGGTCCLCYDIEDIDSIEVTIAIFTCGRQWAWTIGEQ